MPRKRGGDARVFRDAGEGFGVEVEGFVAAEAGVHEFRPGVAGEVAHEVAALPAEFLALGLDVPHELVDEGDRDLFDLGLGVGDLAHQDVAGGVDAAAGFDV